MSMMRTEYSLECLRDGEVRIAHGPYDSLEYAKKMQASAEKLRDEYGPDRIARDDTYRIAERDVTEWTPIPTTPPE
jgi:hypothetical protein